MFLFALPVYYGEKGCYPFIPTIFIMAQSILFIFLFTDFYIKAYVKAKKVAAVAAAAAAGKLNKSQ